MKANELRLGNYAKDSVLGIIEIDSTDKIYHAENLEPIPLTEEWLVKFSFDPDKDDYLGTSIVWEEDICIYDHGDNIYSLYRYNDQHVYIKYIHQLQNLYFALTGQELEIK